MFFFYFWIEIVLAIINSAKIGMISYLPLLQGSNLYVPHLNDSIFYVEIEILDPKIFIEDPEHIHIFLIYFETLSPLSPGKVQFIFKIVKIAHKIRNYLFIISILSFHYLISF